MKYAGREAISGVEHHVLAITLSDGFVTYRYIDPATWLIDRGRDFRAFHPAMDGQKKWLETVWTDYRSVEGVMRPFLSTVTEIGTGEWQSTTTVRRIKVNPSFDDARFAKPSSRAP